MLSFLLWLDIALLLVSRLHLKTIDRHAKSFDGACTYAPIMTTKRAGIIAKISSEIPDGGGESQSESDDEDLPLEKLPLDSKLQQKLEHKMRMKSWKKMRLRNKKIIRKRRMRKRGCWPPSKMKKLSNIWPLLQS